MQFKTSDIDRLRITKHSMRVWTRVRMSQLRSVQRVEMLKLVYNQESRHAFRSAGNGMDKLKALRASIAGYLMQKSEMFVLIEIVVVCFCSLRGFVLDVQTIWGFSC